MSGVATLIAGTARLSDSAYVGQTVGSLRRQFASVYNIAPTARGQINGRDANETAALSAGDELVFTKPAGEKG